MAFGVFTAGRLLGAMTFGVGPTNAFSLVEAAKPDECLTLSRLWLSDELPRNSESRFIGIVTRALTRNTRLRFLVSYADPSQGHFGTIYQATGWVYTGLSQATPLYDIGDSRHYHSRSLSHSFGSHGLSHFQRHGIDVKLVPQQSKYRYLYFLDPAWRARLRVPALPYPKRKVSGESN
ncbi:MAG TPA: DNA methyltransferase [Dehalococcoidia bacterium]|nr:DNA methyltransferase [Dehalococcoidia bacterium]